MDLSLEVVDDAGVEDDRLAAGEDGGGAGPASVDVEGLRRVDRRVDCVPVDQVGGHRVGPHDVAPHGAIGVILVEKVVDSLVVKWPCDGFFKQKIQKTPQNLEV